MAKHQCQYRKDDFNGNMIDFESFKFKSRCTNNSNQVRVANIEIAVPLK